MISKNQRGQALVEYILLLVVALTLLMGVIYQFNSAFRVFANRMFVEENSYLACAIKNGILLDGEADGDPCTAPKFNLAEGKTKTGGSASGGSDSNSSQNSSSKNSKGSAAQNKSPSSSSSGGRSDGNSIGLIPTNSGDSKNSGLKSANATDEGKKTNTGNSGISSKAAPFNPDASGSSSKDLDLTRSSRKKSTISDSLTEQQSVSVPLNNRDTKTAREIAFEKSKKKEKGSEAGGIDLSYGNLFKYLMIFLLFFSIIFFVGSQFLAVSRSKKRK